MEENYKPDFTYADFARLFTTEFFDPYQWAKLFQGNEYIYTYSLLIILEH